MKRLLSAIAALVFFASSLFFVVIVASLVKSEVLPGLGRKTLSVDTSVMILNRVWAGNEIYLLLAAYTLLACVLAYVGLKLLRMARAG